MDALKNELKQSIDQIQKKAELLPEDLEILLLALLMEEDGNEFVQNK